MIKIVEFRKNYICKFTHFSIVTERSPQACKPARISEDLPSARSGCFIFAQGNEIAFSVSIDNTLHVTIWGPTGIAFPGLGEKKKQGWYKVTMRETGTTERTLNLWEKEPAMTA